VLKKVEGHKTKGLPFAMYRKPFEEHVTCIFQMDDRLYRSLNFGETGFVFAPFDLKDNAVLIRIGEIQKAPFQSDKIPVGTPNLPSKEDKEFHIKLVQKGIAEIEKKELGKVVLSRKIEVDVSKTPVHIFQTLLGHYPGAFCYLFYHPRVGTWCGATPETLMRIKNLELHTMSLAATLPINGDKPPEWGYKEVQEQKMVSTYIQERLTGSMEYLTVGSAESVKAGNLWHLKSEIRGKMFPEAKLKDIITALHPTPAVCGVPMKAAKEFILTHENYKRTFYTGFLGELNMGAQKETHLFVNLRCMELHGTTASVFVGGGITSASNPESEWVETQNKSMTMLNSI